VRDQVLRLAVGHVQTEPREAPLQRRQQLVVAKVIDSPGVPTSNFAAIRSAARATEIWNARPAITLTTNRNPQPSCVKLDPDSAAVQSLVRKFTDSLFLKSHY
jgi:hypothetical protein